MAARRCCRGNRWLHHHKKEIISNERVVTRVFCFHGLQQLREIALGELLPVGDMRRFGLTGLVDFEFHPRANNIFSSSNKFVTVKGPGLVYIDMQAGNRFFKEVQLSLFLIILYCMLYVLMFAIITLDKMDYLGKE